jgi:hypothetical protein
MYPKRSTKRRSSKRSSSNSSRKTSWTRKLMAWRRANRHVDGSLPSMKIAMKACKGRSQKRSKCRKSAGRKPKSGKRSSKRRSTRRKSPKRTSPIRKMKKYYPSFVGKRFQKFERPSSMPQYATSAPSATAAPSTTAAPSATRSALLLTGPYEKLTKRKNTFDDKGKYRATSYTQKHEQSKKNNIVAFNALMNGDIGAYKQAISDFGVLELSHNDNDHHMLLGTYSSALAYYHVNNYYTELLDVFKSITPSDLWNEYFNNREQRLLMLKNSVDTITGNEEMTKWYINNLDYTEEEKEITYTYPSVIADPKIKSIIENKSLFSTLVGGFF